MSAGEPPDEWRPPGMGGSAGELKTLAADSLKATLELRQNKPIHKPSTREKECHGKLLNLAIKMGIRMKLQEEQVRINTAYGDL